MRSAPCLRGICWDLDGTLIDSERLHFESLADVASRFGLRFDEADNEALLGAAMRDKWAAFEPVLGRHLDETGWRALCRDAYLPLLGPGLGRPGPLAALRRAARMGLPQALVSNGDAEVVRANLDILGIGHVFSAVLTAGDCARGKPDPAPYLLACERLGLHPSACLAVEDSAAGLASARAAGLTVAAWPHNGPGASGSGGLLSASLEAAHRLILVPEDFPWDLFGPLPAGTSRQAVHTPRPSTHRKEE